MGAFACLLVCSSTFSWPIREVTQSDEKQNLPQCEMTPRARNALKSGDPSGETLAFFERAAPPRPLQAGAPAWLTPGRLRRPLHHQGQRPAISRGACRSGL